ncbi:metalloprotease-like protein [Hirsutella rhossiliensis]|uniref:Metalloprotease-like protein n=1 Tax=Hirsutella rhossiliensis TaxID=111463 RepID=A0A9P8N3A5_9HYPO|nr:metalloprotease-like protein [Hirsutella rhossiliensis]KAH0966040.1 metalloprotease-like protein [Hirsutella rhossiliensis]
MSELRQEIETLRRLVEKERREKEQERREKEQERREKEEAKAREEQERQKSQKTTLEEYLFNCHFYLYTKLAFADKTKSSMGLATRVDKKYYPKRLRPWNAFANSQRHQQFSEIRRVCGESRLFHQESTTRDLGATISYDPAGNENAIEYFERIAVEVPVREILAPVWNQKGPRWEHQVTMLRFSHNARDFTQLSDSQIEDEGPSSGRQKRQRRTGTTMRNEFSREIKPPPMKPDGWGIRTHLDGDESMAFVYDFKAAHKFAAPYLKATLAKERLFIDVIARDNSNKYKIDPQLQEQEIEETRIAMALTQVFDYMVWYGVAYGYIAAGKSLVLLHIDQEDLQTLYYHLCVPDEEVVEALAGDRAGQVPYTAVAQLAGFCLLSLQSEALRGNSLNTALQKARKELKIWGEPYEDAVLSFEAEGVNSSSQSSSQGTDGSEFQCVADPTKRVYPLRSKSSCMAAAVRCRNDNDDEHGPEGGPSRTRTKTDTNERSKGPPSGSYENKEAATPDPGPTRQYCTQACLLGLKRGWELDDNCPNVLSHRITKGSTRHPIDAGEFTRLVGKRLRQNPYRDCKALDGRGKVGAIGVLFKLELAPYGYTFVGKGTLSDHLYRLEHESRIYAHLDRLQGEVVPVYLDIVQLARGYVFPGGARVVYMMLMSWAGEVAAEAGALDLAAEVRRSSQAVWAEGVYHGDEREPNLLWNDERRRVMLVDFDRAALLPAPKHKQLIQLSRDKRKQQRDGSGTRSRKRGSQRGHLQLVE